MRFNSNLGLLPWEENSSESVNKTLLAWRSFNLIFLEYFNSGLKAKKVQKWPFPVPSTNPNGRIVISRPFEFQSTAKVKEFIENPQVKDLELNQGSFPIVRKRFELKNRIILSVTTFLVKVGVDF